MINTNNHRNTRAAILLIEEKEKKTAFALQ